MNDRGQTTLDFVVGISVFLLTLAFVVAFVPQMLVPYGNQDRPVASERVTNTLADDLLGDARPSVLDTRCTRAFLTQNASAAGGCPFDPADPVADQVGVGSDRAVNVTLRRDVAGGPDREVLCAENGSIGACGPGGERLAVGPAVPAEKRSVATDRRTVYVDGRDAVLEVALW